MQDGIAYAKKYGGCIDLTTSFDVEYAAADEVKASRGLKMALEQGVPAEKVTFSSDAQGSLPVFAPDGSFAGLGVGSITSLYQEIKDTVLEEGLPLETALMAVTSNPAAVLRLAGKGRIEEEMDADLLLADQETLEIDSVFAKGKQMMAQGELLVKGTFE